MSGKERASQKKQAAEREMKIRLEKEAELLDLRKKLKKWNYSQKRHKRNCIWRNVHEHQQKRRKVGLVENVKVKQKKQEAKLKKGQMKEFLKDIGSCLCGLISDERQKELDEETKQFGSELYERSVMGSLTLCHCF